MPKKAFPAAAEGMPEEDRGIVDAIDFLVEAMGLNDLIYFACETRHGGNANGAIVTGSSILGDMLDEVKAILYANLEREGRA